MADDELAAIRKARLEQLKAQGGGGGGGAGGGDQAQRHNHLRFRSANLIRPAAEQRQSILNQILERGAADRLGRIRLVNEQRATEVENRLIMLARQGALKSAVTEEQLKDLLNAVAETREEEKIVVSRRKGWDDDDDDLLDL
ncbi:Double-stranded DNA-binding protein [Glarea lozoyensis ATCC 20868]|uniref:Double-stranded DNA-binding protein n=1 Tax=Glarea lozoyensis (strain ATCC 20868 / MF5171) TaxID=1116229 RepID=S3D2Y0_GLAL2|nr:Double-stranded DNA-binding protein [Glarea lozoyensis ATCC 20868]EPE32170.1 Double-stranded DNA-binding protein [Glarea lozoyensis ATCC 20868]